MKNFKELFDKNEFKWDGANLYIYLFMLLITLIAVYIPYGGKEEAFLEPNFLTVFTILAVFSTFFGVIGDRIPIWNDYIGGGPVLVFIMAAVIGTYRMIPESFLKHVEVFYNDAPVDFLGIFIPVLIVGSVLAVNRNTLIKSMVGYIPLIIIGVVGATIGGVGAGILFGKNPLDVIMNYVLPIMGGGTGAGAIPLSKMWAAKTGRPAEQWFAFAISILTIANIIAIITGAILRRIGDIKSNLSGDGQLLMDETKEAIKDKQVEVKAELVDVAVTLVLTGTLMMFARILGILWKSMKLPFDIHELAFLIVTVILINVFNIVPDRIKAGAKRLQAFFSKHTLGVLMAAVGFGTDVNEIIKALTFSNLVIALAIVFGAVALIMLTSRKMKFYPVEAAITAGLCMANRGGSGDVAVLGAADRMELMPFAQISSRVGGAMILIIGSVIFGLFA